MQALQAWFFRPFGLLDTVKARLQLVIFCGVFGCIFLNVFQPFNMEQWFPNVKTPMFFIITFFSAAGMAALALSQFAIRSLFKIRLTTRVGFLTWLILDFFLISLATQGVNSIFTERSFFDLIEYLLTLKYTLLVLVLPYSLGVLLLFVERQLEVVKELKLKVDKSISQENVVINDENGKSVMRINSKNILYFKSEDNYVLLFYKVDDQLKKELIRTTLKKLEQELNSSNFIRIHRSYMINSQNLVSATKTSKGYQVLLDSAAKVDLPVSSTYQDIFAERCIQNPAE